MKVRLLAIGIMLLLFKVVAAAVLTNFGSQSVLWATYRGSLGEVNPGRVCLERDAFQPARESLALAVWLAPTRANAYSMLGRLEQLANCSERAQTWLEEGSLFAPSDMMLALQLGEMYSAQDDLVNAVRIWRLSPAILELYIKSGDSAAFDHNWVRAEVAFRRAVAIDPSSAAARWGLGEVFYGQGYYDEAVEIFTIAKMLGMPRDGYKIVEYAHVLDMLGRGAEAVHLLDEFNVRGVLADLIRGSFYRSVGDLNKAIYFLESSVQQSPQDPWSRHALAITYARQGLRESAITQLRAALEFNPQFQPASDLLGCLSAAADPKQCVTP